MTRTTSTSERLARATGATPRARRQSQAPEPTAVADVGLPAFLTEPRTVLVAFLLAVMALSQVYVGVSEYFKRDPWTDNPTCMPLSVKAGEDSTPQWTAKSDLPMYINRVRLGAAHDVARCAEGRCSKEQNDDMYVALSRYLDTRYHAHETALEQHGVSGLAWMRDHFQSQKDYQILISLADMDRQGQLQWKRLGKVTAAHLRLLLRNPGGQPPICARSTG